LVPVRRTRTLPVTTMSAADLPPANSPPRHRWQAPDADGTVLSQPPLADAVEVASRNGTTFDAIDIDLQSRSWLSLRRLAREQAIESARKYTSHISPLSLRGRGAGGEGRSERLHDPSPPTALPKGERGEAHDREEPLLFVTGHQPALFHPGVWVKNFAIARLASRATGGVALNLVVDNDVMTSASTAVRVPAGSRESPRFDSIPLDDPRPAQPWEEATVLNRDLFRTFADRAAGAIRPWSFEPLVGELWSAARRELDRSTNLTDCLTAARHDVERRWGVNNLELPLSRLCETDAFRWFACHVLANLARFRDVYNSALAEYRRVNRVRSQSHPVPELSERDGWLEAPFRVWRKGDSQRNRVFARQVDRELHLSDGRDVFARLPLSPACDATAAVAALGELPLQGIRFRTRALTTTLFARLFLADLFVHGIGGAKYDEMTDQIIAEFYRVPVPEFLTLTATARLPLQPFDVTDADRQQLQQRLREFRFHPERFLLFGEQTGQAEILGMKAGLAASRAVGKKWRAKLRASGKRINPRSKRGQRPRYFDVYLKIQELNRELGKLVADQRDQTATELSVVSRQLAANQVLASREFSYCLFPAEKLRDFMDGIAI